MLETGRGLHGYDLLHCRKINPFHLIDVTWLDDGKHPTSVLRSGTQTSVIQMLIRLNSSVTWSLARVNNTSLISGHQHMAIVQEKRLILQIVLFNLNIQQQHVLRNMRWYWENNCLWLHFINAQQFSRWNDQYTNHYECSGCIILVQSTPP